MTPYDSQILNADDLDDVEDLYEEEQDDDQPALPRRRMKEDADLDITPMIDCVFLLLIFFIVSSKLDQTTAVELPPARHGDGVSQEDSFIITIAKGEGNEPAAVYLGDGADGEPLSNNKDQQKAEIIEQVQKAFRSGAAARVLVKAAVGVKHKYVSQVGQAIGAAGVETQLYIGVYESD
jgi:biopolymer transport protein ExbD